MDPSGISLPLPPTTGQLAEYGLAGLIFAAFLFLVGVIITLGWRFLQGRERTFGETLAKRDTDFTSALERVEQSHDAALTRIASKVEDAGKQTSSGMHDMATALRELQRLFDRFDAAPRPRRNGA